MSYIPITDFFDHQPPTKTFEYLMAGMPVVATGTVENRRLITEINGILTGDSEDDVFAGLRNLLVARHRFDSREIHRSIQQYSWEDIVLKDCLPYLGGIVQGFRSHS
jgi:glycosyltransferase involved in cell wall biosynthesis